MFLTLPPRLRSETTVCWLAEVEFGDYVTVTTDNGHTVRGMVAHADETGVCLYDHDEVDHTHHEDEWECPAEEILSAGHVAPPDTWSMAWCEWPWKYMRHLRPARGRQTGTAPLLSSLQPL